MKSAFGYIVALFAAAVTPLCCYGTEPLPLQKNTVRDIIVTDIILSHDGRLNGVVTADNGTPMANQLVQVVYQQSVVAEVYSDADGHYAVDDIRSGVHVVRSSGAEVPCRFWTPDTAPPSAQNEIRLVSHLQVVPPYPAEMSYAPVCGEIGCGEGCGGACGRAGMTRGLLGNLGFGAAGAPLVAVGAIGAAGVAAGVAAADGNGAILAPAPASP
ncbi:MAG: hypothetical protein KDA89_09725 [Planctomycetaceae bacterium]|nr:hypothetical protein [Planctomycetaceae bacterium]